MVSFTNSDMKLYAVIAPDFENFLRYNGKFHSYTFFWRLAIPNLKSPLSVYLVMGMFLFVLFVVFVYLLPAMVNPDEYNSLIDFVPKSREITHFFHHRHHLFRSKHFTRMQLQQCQSRRAGQQGSHEALITAHSLKAKA